MNAVKLSVPDISCDHCKTSIESAVGALDGIQSVGVDIEARTVAVAFDAQSLDLGTIHTAIEEQGYEVAGSLGSHDDES